MCDGFEVASSMKRAGKNDRDARLVLRLGPKPCVAVDANLRSTLPRTELERAELRNTFGHLKSGSVNNHSKSHGAARATLTVRAVARVEGQGCSRQAVLHLGTEATSKIGRRIARSVHCGT